MRYYCYPFVKYDYNTRRYKVEDVLNLYVNGEMADGSKTYGSELEGFKQKYGKYTIVCVTINRKRYFLAL